MKLINAFIRDIMPASLELLKVQCVDLPLGLQNLQIPNNFKMVC